MKLRVPLFILLGALASSCGDDATLVGIEAESVQLGQGRTGPDASCSTTGEASAPEPGPGTTGGVSTSSTSTTTTTTTTTTAPGGIMAVSPECVGRENGAICGDYAICVQERCMPPLCGDGVLTLWAGEGCDDANRTRHDGCYACAIERCGDGILHAGEECDDGNNIRTDGCDTLCKRTAVNLCGNGKLDGKEQCDDGNAVNDDNCSNLCRLAPSPSCGNGTVDNGEACDDGNNRDHDGCSANCQEESCGDGVLRPRYEQCDDGNQVDGDGCTADCKSERGEFSVCGNGIVEAGEDCDDANTRNSDDCPNDCQNPVCGDGVREGVETCDDGNTEPGDGCDETCGQEAVCGNGIVEFVVGKEHCDDGGPDPDDPESNFDNCPDNCRMPVCGDDFRSGAFEECDGEDKAEGQVCDAECKIQPVCGNGIVEVSNVYPDLSETCDDGNTEGGDDCPANCRGINLSKCGDGVVDEQNGEQCDFGEETMNLDPKRTLKSCRRCQWNFFDQKCSECILAVPEFSLESESQYCVSSETSPCSAVLDCYVKTRCVEKERIPGNLFILACLAGQGKSSTDWADLSQPLEGACLDEALAGSYSYTDEKKITLTASDRAQLPGMIANFQTPMGRAGYTFQRILTSCVDECSPYLNPEY